MAKPIFRVNLAQGAPDFQHMATEPGLAMLDRAGANYAILKRWLGDFMAEPQWRGETLVEFFVTEEKRGRLEQVDFNTLRKADLEKTLKQDLETLAAKIKKIRPESTNEQILHRIITTTYKKLTDNLDSSEFDCYFFKYREGSSDWRLLWCWGYQRTDQQPLPALICTDETCQQIFVRRPENPGICPGCQSVVRRKRRRIMRTVLSSGGMVTALALAILFIVFNLPKLEVTPAQWHGPIGSRVQFKVHYKRWFFFNDDVTAAVIPQTNDSRILEFDKRGVTARAKKLGRTSVTFRYLDRVNDVAVQVNPVKEPDSLTIEPSDVRLAVGSTAKIRVMGRYKDDSEPVDLTEVSAIEVKDTKVAFFHDEYLEGAAEGATSYTAEYRWQFDAKPKEAKGTARVEERKFVELELACDPPKLMLSQSGKLTINAIDDRKDKWSVLGSTHLENNLAPATVAELDGEYVQGKSPGTATLTARFSDPELTKTLAITVTNESAVPSGTFAVTPKEVTDLYVGNYLALNVVANPSAGKVEGVSSDPTIVEVVGADRIVGRKPGKAVVTFTQGANKESINVTVVEAKYAQIRIEPKLVALEVGKPKKMRVFGMIEKKTQDPDGKWDIKWEDVELSPASLEVPQQPLPENANLNRDTLELFGLMPTTSMQKLVVSYNGLTDEADVEVVGEAKLAVTLEEDDEFLAYPPLARGSTFGVNGLIYDKGGVVIRDGVDKDSVLAGLPVGSVVTEINGRSLEGLSAPELRALLAKAKGSKIKFVGTDGVVSDTILNELPTIDQPVKVLAVVDTDRTAADFNLEVELSLYFADDYRLLSATKQPISDWTKVGALGHATLRTTTKIARVQGNEEYDVYLERKSGRTYQIPFRIGRK